MKNSKICVVCPQNQHNLYKEENMCLLHKSNCEGCKEKGVEKERVYCKDCVSFEKVTTCMDNFYKTVESFVEFKCHNPSCMSIRYSWYEKTDIQESPWEMNKYNNCKLYVKDLSK